MEHATSVGPSKMQKRITCFTTGQSEWVKFPTFCFLQMHTLKSDVILSKGSTTFCYFINLLISSCFIFPYWMVPLYHGFVLFSSMTCILQTYYLLVLLLVQLIPIQFNKALSLNLFENIILFIFFSDKNVNGAAKSSASSGPVGADFKPLLSTATATSYQSPPVTSTGKYLSVIFFFLLRSISWLVETWGIYLAWDSCQVWLD